MNDRNYRIGYVDLLTGTAIEQSMMPGEQSVSLAIPQDDGKILMDIIGVAYMLKPKSYKSAGHVWICTKFNDISTFDSKDTIVTIDFAFQFAGGRGSLLDVSPRLVAR